MKPLAITTLVFVLALPAKLPAQNGELPRFDVASVKISTQPFLEINPTRSGGRIHWTTDLPYVLGYAYRMQPWRISGPVPGSTSIYDFDLAASPNASDDEVRRMFRSLLIDRFKMTFHLVTNEVDGYALSVAKGGPKMEAAQEQKIPPLPGWFAARSSDSAPMEGHVVSTLAAAGVGNLVGRRVTAHDLCESLQRIVGSAVFDRTALAGSYYFALQYANADAPPDVTFPNLFAAVKDLGLKLEKHRGPVEMLVVDHIEKTPTEN